MRSNMRSYTEHNDDVRRYSQTNYIGEHFGESQCLLFIREMMWDSRGDGLGEPQDGSWFYHRSEYQFKIYRNESWQPIDTQISEYFHQQDRSEVETNYEYVIRRFTRRESINSALYLNLNYPFEERPLIRVSYLWHNREFHNSFLVLDSIRREKARFYDIISRGQIDCPLGSLVGIEIWSESMTKIMRDRFQEGFNYISSSIYAEMRGSEYEMKKWRLIAFISFLCSLSILVAYIFSVIFDA